MIRYFFVLVIFCLLPVTYVQAQDAPWEGDAGMPGAAKQNVESILKAVDALKDDVEKRLQQLNLSLSNTSRAITNWEMNPLRWTGDSDEDRMTGYQQWTRRRRLVSLDRDLERIDELMQSFTDLSTRLESALEDAKQNQWPNSETALLACKEVLTKCDSDLSDRRLLFTQLQERLRSACEVDGHRPDPFKDTPWEAPEGFSEELTEEINGLCTELSELHEEINAVLDVYSFEHNQARTLVDRGRLTEAQRLALASRVPKKVDLLDRLVERVEKCQQFLENAQAQDEMTPAKETLSAWHKSCGKLSAQLLAMKQLSEDLVK